MNRRLAAIDGQLYWTPESSKAPLAVIILGAAIVIGGLLFVLLVGRRRTRNAAMGGASTARHNADASPDATGEAW